MRGYGYSFPGYLLYQQIQNEENPRRVDLLLHVLNVIENNSKCGYMGRGYQDKESTDERCLASKYHEGEIQCPLFNKDYPGNCVYVANTLNGH